MILSHQQFLIEVRRNQKSTRRKKLRFFYREIEHIGYLFGFERNCCLGYLVLVVCINYLKSKVFVLKDVSNSQCWICIRRKKKGFGNPIDYWFRNVDRKETYDCLTNQDNAIFHFIDYHRTHKAFPTIMAGYNGENTGSIRRLTVLAHYLDSFKENLKI